MQWSIYFRKDSGTPTRDLSTGPSVNNPKSGEINDNEIALSIALIVRRYCPEVFYRTDVMHAFTGNLYLNYMQFTYLHLTLYSKLTNVHN